MSAAAAAFGTHDVRGIIGLSRSRSSDRVAGDLLTFWPAGRRTGSARRRARRVRPGPLGAGRPLRRPVVALVGARSARWASGEYRGRRSGRPACAASCPAAGQLRGVEPYMLAAACCSGRSWWQPVPEPGRRHRPGRADGRGSPWSSGCGAPPSAAPVALSRRLRCPRSSLPDRLPDRSRRPGRLRCRVRVPGSGTARSPGPRPGRRRPVPAEAPPSPGTGHQLNARAARWL